MVLFAFAVSEMLYIAALAVCFLRSKNQLFLPITDGRTAFSAGLLSGVVPEVST